MMQSGSSVAPDAFPYLHFTKGDAVWFVAWAPQSAGAIGGACVALFVLAIFQRLLLGARGVVEGEWRQESRRVIVERAFTTANLDDEKSLEMTPASSSATPVDTLAHPQRAELFQSGRPAAVILAHEFGRGAFVAMETAVSFLLLLAVLTRNASYLISIIVGLGVGQTLFGRFISPLTNTFLF